MSVGVDRQGGGKVRYNYPMKIKPLILLGLASEVK
jgi:hypothetical protein